MTLFKKIKACLINSFDSCTSKGLKVCIRLEINGCGQTLFLANAAMNYKKRKIINILGLG